MPQTQTQTSERPFLKSVPEQSTADVHKEIAVLAAKLGAGPATLVPMLSELILSWGSIPETALAEIATALHVSYAKVHRVASFYSQLEGLDRGTMAA
jgi:NADH:ubiquinone oxidoreductase subunit E